MWISHSRPPLWATPISWTAQAWVVFWASGSLTPWQRCIVHFFICQLSNLNVNQGKLPSSCNRVKNFVCWTQKDKYSRFLDLSWQRIQLNVYARSEIVSGDWRTTEDRITNQASLPTGPTNLYHSLQSTFFFFQRCTTSNASPALPPPYQASLPHTMPVWHVTCHPRFSECVHSSWQVLSQPEAMAGGGAGAVVGGEHVQVIASWLMLVYHTSQHLCRSSL